MLAPTAQAQHADRTSETRAVAWHQASLVGWRDRLHLALRDQRHAFGGLFFDRGRLRKLVPEMDHEYDLDLMTFTYTLQEDAAWYQAPHGFRTYMGSISTSRFATQNHFRATVPIGGRHTVRLSGVQQEDLQALRFFVEFGYDYRLSTRQRLGFTETIAAYKPDLDFSLFYQHGDVREGLVRAEVFLLDIVNNFIFDGLGVDPVLEDTTRSYRRKPRLFTLYLTSPPLGHFRAELATGLQPQARTRVASQAAPDSSFRFYDAAGYAGGLMEYAFPAVTLGLVYRYTQTSAARRPDPGSALTSDYSSTQRAREATLYILANVWRVRGEAWLGREIYTDRQQGTDFSQASIPAPLAFKEQRRTVHLRLRYVPAAAGLLAGLSYLDLGRRFPSDYEPIRRYLRFAPQSPSRRLSVHVGYQFTPRASIVFGGNVDVDGDAFYGDRGLTYYDGGFCQISIVW